MVSWVDVQRWDIDRLGAAVDKLNKYCDTLTELNDEVTTSSAPREWHGGASHAAASNLGTLTDDLDGLVAGVGAVRRAAHEAEGAVNALLQAIAEAKGLAAAHDFVINASGAVQSVSPVPAADLPPDVVAERDRVQAEVADRVEQILRRADDVDNDIADVIGRAILGTISEGDSTTLAQAAEAGAAQGGLSVLGPPQGGTPGDNSGWWASLSEAERRQILRAHPEWIGNLDGVPAKYRDEANRARLPMERARLEAEAQRLREELDGNLFGGTFSGADDRLAEVEAKLESLNAIETVLSFPDRHLLNLDLSDSRAEAAIANGDVDTADHVSVFTPGFTSTVDGSMERYDQNLNDLRLQTEDVLKTTDPGATVATVTWIGYQAPQATLESVAGPGSTVLGEEAARAGAKELNSFLNGLDTARTADAHLTALGHSYGSLTTGLALQDSSGVDDAVMFGSPGLGTGSTSDLRVPDGHVTSIEANEDMVADMGRSGHLGEDPSTMEGMRHGETGAVGAERNIFGKGLVEVTGHSGYLTPNSTSQYNMAVIVAGEQDLVIEGNNTDIGDALGQTGRDFAHETWEIMPWNWG
ncbi:alpha/beta hydrolase [Amycolatopsis palatopharyngis]|uniref:alpha/beta hydrolase n=1 Tax=Amycolatopsis palatopharyngis TaxID=187982 RepID=UPI000E2239B0|nr:alpha/beta hydrolase [Amycolatopsis palatopharyngis]